MPYFIFQNTISVPPRSHDRIQFSGLRMQNMYYIGLDANKRTISYCVKDGSGTIHAEGTIPATRFDLDRWMKTLPQPWTAAMEATVFTPCRFEFAGKSRIRHVTCACVRRPKIHS